ncbi:LPS translocon maturation chaperone LptM [Roseateles violae]|uniref:Lipoprotein n=1 Tax=Roseateles violae TaxID=3058042 RepID=A0ABT8DX46_9BURK|nr:lipoprotein [Pelomonas sp. PFR6]MDN3921134.1 lipoprotein [Pelomonas sp. PFR6]
MKTNSLLRSVCLPCAVLALGLLGACGQKGPLTLPKPASAASAPVAAPALPPASTPIR